MILKQLEAGHPDIPAVKKLYEEAFPENERPVGIDEILAYAEQMPFKLLGIYLDDTPDSFAGFFLVVEGESSVYAVYLAIAPEKRSGGIGSKAMNAMRDYYGEKPQLFSYESIYQESDNMEQRIRRRNLYLKLGFHETGWLAMMNGTEFILASSKEEFTEEDKQAFIKFLSDMTGGAEIPELYRRD